MDFGKYLSKFKTSKNNQTHLSLKGGKYFVPDEALSTFNNEYYNAIYKNKAEAWLVEKIYDRKFKFFLDIERPTNKEDIDQLTDDKIISIVNNVSEIIDSNQSTSQSEYIVSKNFDKIRYHVVWFNTVVNKEIAMNIIESLRDEFKEYIDTSVYRTGLRMLGSKKADSDSVYVLYDLYTEQEIKITKPLFIKTCIHVRNKSEINVFTDVNSNSDSEITDVTNDKISNRGRKVSKCKFRDISEDTRTELETLVSKLSKEPELNNMNLTLTSVVSKDNKVGIRCYYMSIEEQFCPFKQRAHKRKNSPLYLELQLNKVFVRCHDSDCERSRFPEGGIIVDLSEYPNLSKTGHVNSKDVEINIDPETREFLEKGLSLTHYKISKLVYHLYKNKYMVSEPGRTGVWYMFDKHRWKISNQINIDISEEIPKYYNAISSSKQDPDDLQEYLENDDESELSKRNKIINNLKIKLETMPFKEAILSQSKIIFNQADPDFYQKLDQTQGIIGFENGVYDFNTLTFREGRINDYLTYTTGYDYIEYDPNNENIIEIESIISKIIPNNNVKTYLLKILAKALVGIPDERFYMFIGFSGANGKSTLINMLEYALNDYMTSVEVSLLTNKRGNSSNASPEVMKMKGKRIISMQEPESEDIIHTGLLRQLTGNDTLVARELYKNCISFKLQGTMIMCANETPNINSINEAVWRRIRVIDFPSRFVENPKKDNEFKIDHTLKEKIPMMGKYMMSLLIYYYTQYKDDKSEPDEVLISTLNYNREANIFSEFLDKYTVPSDISTDFNKILASFKHYWIELDIQEKMPSLKDLRRALKIRYGNNGSNNKTFNLKLIYSDDSLTLDNDDDL